MVEAKDRNYKHKLSGGGGGGGVGRGEAHSVDFLLGLIRITNEMLTTHEGACLLSANVSTPISLQTLIVMLHDES